MLSVCALMLLTGCTSMTGHWTMVSVTPESAKDAFDLRCMSLNDDGTYLAYAAHHNKTEQMNGTYKYDQATKTLTFTGTKGKERKYHVDLISLGGEMKVSGGEKGKEWTAVMKRCKACPTDQCVAVKKGRDPKQSDPKACPHRKAAAEAVAK
jgi:hypothetical protein